MSEYSLSSTLHQLILCGIKQAWGQKKTLEIYRELGGQIREAEFGRIWRETWEGIEEWAQQQTTK